VTDSSSVSPAARRQRKCRFLAAEGMAEVVAFIPADMVAELREALEARGYPTGADDLALALALGDLLRDTLGLD
jgi:hypothetical protein